MSDTGTGDIPLDVEIGVAQSNYDALDYLKNTLNFSVINHLDVRHRTRVAQEIVWQHLDDKDRREIIKLSNNRKRWYLIEGSTLPHDGTIETITTLQMGLLACADSRPFGYLEGNGSVARLVTPKAGSEDTLTTSGRRPFDAHIDHAWGRFPWEPDNGTPIIPDFLSLAGHINPGRVATMFADPVEIYANLSELTQYVLERPEWSFPSPSSVNPARIATRLPIVSRGPDRLPVIRLSPRVISETQRAREALAELESLLQNSSLWTEIVLETGDIVVARGTALHKRGEVVGPRELVAMYGRHKSTNSGVLSEANQHLEPVR